MKKLATPTVPLAYTAAQAAAALSVGPDFFEQHVAPELRIVRRGSKRLYSVAEIERWLAENAEVPMTEQVGG
jgi:hypothetical protein